jgi:hypothetical protein
MKEIAGVNRRSSRVEADGSQQLLVPFTGDGMLGRGAGAAHGRQGDDQSREADAELLA